MGTSNWQNISYVIELIRAINPTKILDFGIGFGRWGILCREFLEVWDEGNYTGKWSRQIDGIEVFPGYIKPYHSHFYDNIFITEGYEWLKKCNDNYNLIICGDVIEHFEKNLAIEIIDLSLKMSDYVLINLPIGDNWEQLESNGNKYEEHKSVWHISDFRNYKYKVVKTFQDYTGRKFCVILVSLKPISIYSLMKNKYGRYYKIRNLLNYKLNLNKLIEYIRK